MTATLNYDLKQGMRELYQGDRWGVLSVLILHSNGRGRAFPTTATICQMLDRCIQTVIDARNWLFDHKAIELVPYEKRTGSELILPKRQFVYQLTGHIDFGDRMVPYLYEQNPKAEKSESPEDNASEVLPDRTLEGGEVLPDRSSTGQNQSISSKDSSIPKEDSDSSLRSESGANPANTSEQKLAALSKPSGPEPENLPPLPKAGATPGLRCPVQECGGFLVFDVKHEQYYCPLCHRSYKKTANPGLWLLPSNRPIPIDLPQADPPIGFVWLYTTEMGKDVHLVKVGQSYEKSKALCKARVGHRVQFSRYLDCVTRAPCPDCLRIANEPKSPPKAKEPRPRNPVFDAIALGSYNMNDAPPKGYIGKLAVGVKDCTVQENQATLAADLTAMYAWYKVAHKELDAPAKIETICKYLAEWRDERSGKARRNGYNRNLADDAARRSSDFVWGPRSGLPVVRGDGNKNDSPAPQVGPGPKTGV